MQLFCAAKNILFRSLAHNFLFWNSFFLMGSTAILSVFGFLFWLVAAKFYSPGQIGTATVLISLVNLIGSFSLLGTGNALIRYLPNSREKNAKISSVLLVVIGTSVVLFFCYILGVRLFTPSLARIVTNPLFAIGLGMSIIVGTVNLLSDALFIAFRSSQYVLLKNGLLCLIKIGLVFFLISLGAIGLFSAFSIATAIAVILSFVVLIRRYSYRFIPQVKKSILLPMWKYSFGSYIANFVITMPVYVMPIVLLNKLDAHQSAYFYVSYMIANGVFTIPFAVSQSLVTESSYDYENKSTHVIKSMKITTILLMPCLLFLFIFGQRILAAFGQTYTTGGLVCLQLLLLSSLFVTINAIGTAILKVEERIGALIGYSLVLAGTTIVLSLFLLPYKLTGIGMAFLLGSMFGALYNAVIILRLYESKRWRSIAVFGFHNVLPINLVK